MSKYSSAAGTSSIALYCILRNPLSEGSSTYIFYFASTILYSWRGLSLCRLSNQVRHQTGILELVRHINHDLSFNAVLFQCLSRESAHLARAESLPDAFTASTAPPPQERNNFKWQIPSPSGNVGCMEQHVSQNVFPRPTGRFYTFKACPVHICFRVFWIFPLVARRTYQYARYHIREQDMKYIAFHALFSDVVITIETCIERLKTCLLKRSRSFCRSAEITHFLFGRRHRIATISTAEFRLK